MDEKMVKILYKTGDLLRGDETYLLHGCNCRGVMGSGVAKAIREMYPSAYEDYRIIYDRFGLMLGSTIFVQQPNGKTVINAMTQDNFGRTGVHVSYWAIANVFKDLNAVLHGYQLALPMIGAGLGGGDWSVISAIIENEAKTYQPIVYQL